MNAEPLNFALLIAVVGLSVSTPWMYYSEKKWPSSQIQTNVFASLFVTGLISYYLLLKQ